MARILKRDLALEPYCRNAGTGSMATETAAAGPISSHSQGFALNKVATTGAGPIAIAGSKTAKLVNSSAVAR